jgi:hypothetical protein
MHSCVFACVSVCTCVRVSGRYQGSAIGLEPALEHPEPVLRRRHKKLQRARTCPAPNTGFSSANGSSVGLGGLLEVLYEVGHVVVIVVIIGGRHASPVYPLVLLRDLLEILEIVRTQLIDNPREQILESPTQLGFTV